MWQNQKRNDGFLLSGQALAEAEQWAAANDALLQDHERDFLVDCRKAKAQLEKERETARRIKISLYAAVLAGLAFLGAFIWAIVQTRKAEQEAQLATAHRWVSAAFANLPLDPERSLLLALEAIKEITSVKESSLTSKQIKKKAENNQQIAQKALHRAMFTSRIRSTICDDQIRGEAPRQDKDSLGKTAQQHKVSQVVFGPGGQRFAVVRTDGTVKIGDAGAGRFLPPRKR